MNFNGWVPGMRPPLIGTHNIHVDKQYFNMSVEQQQMVFQQFQNELMQQANISDGIISNELEINEPEADGATGSDNNAEQNHAPSYAEIAAPHIQNPENISSVLPVFIEESDMLGVQKSPHRVFIAHTDMYRAITKVIPTKILKGLQRIRGLWRVYLDSEEGRTSLLSKGIVFKGRLVQLHSRNPRVDNRFDPGSIRIRVKDIPLSADDSQITRALELNKCVIKSCFRERLRIDNFLTDCQTGDRLIVALPLNNPLPRSMNIGKYRATIIHRDQENKQQSQTCNKCLQEGHKAYNCTNDWVCRNCMKSGHRQDSCPEKLDDGTETRESDIEEETTQNDVTDDQVVVDMTGGNTEEDKETIAQVNTPRVTKTGNRSSKSSKPKQLFSLTGFMNQSNIPNNPNSMSKTQLERSPRTPPETLRDHEHGETGKKGKPV